MPYDNAGNRVELDDPSVTWIDGHGPERPAPPEPPRKPKRLVTTIPDGIEGLPAVAVEALAEYDAAYDHESDIREQHRAASAAHDAAVKSDEDKKVEWALDGCNGAAPKPAAPALELKRDALKIVLDKAQRAIRPVSGPGAAESRLAGILDANREAVIPALANTGRGLIDQAAAMLDQFKTVGAVMDRAAAYISTGESLVDGSNGYVGVGTRSGDFGLRPLTEALAKEIDRLKHRAECIDPANLKESK